MGAEEEIIEDSEKNWYFVYSDPLTNTRKKYIYLGKYPAESSLAQLQKGEGYIKEGLYKIFNVN